MVKSVSPRSAAKREAILDAAQAIFLDSGYAACSMDAVAAGAGVSKATIYAHFKGKDELFAAVMHRRCESTHAFAAPDAAADARTTLGAIAGRLMDLLLSADALALYRVVVTEAARQPDLARAYYETGPVRGKTAIAAAFERLMDRGELDRADPMTLTDQFIGMLRAETYHRELFGLPKGRSIDATVAAAVDTLMRAYGRR